MSIPAGYTQTAGVTRVGGNGTISVTNLPTLQTITIAAGRIEGTGTITANVANSGVLAPGLSAGQLTIAGDLSLTATSDFRFEIGGLLQGTEYDRLSEAGTVALNLAGTLNVALINGFTPAFTDTFTIISSNQAITGLFSNVVSGRIVNSDGMSSFGLSVVGNNVVLSAFVIPEPSSALLVAAGLGILGLRRRRRA